MRGEIMFKINPNPIRTAKTPTLTFRFYVANRHHFMDEMRFELSATLYGVLLNFVFGQAFH